MDAVVGASLNQRSREEALSTIRMLVSHGANVRARNQERANKHSDSLNVVRQTPPQTALEYAAWNGTPEVLVILAESGAIRTRDDILHAISFAIPHGYRNLPTLWQLGRRFLAPPLTLAETIPFLNEDGLRILIEEMPDGMDPVDITERDYFTGETASAKIRNRIGMEPDSWGGRENTYAESALELLKAQPHSP